MAGCEKLLQKIANNAENVRFDDACKLAECYGFVLARTKGSHHIYKRSGIMTLVNLQPDENNKAKPYQVKQLLNVIEQINSSD